ncbi:hypothetical protein BHM03_00054420 [Ensete ventricosum]|nr:hypothetical protein BHM03_00054420 [Ensete ventricosum]
MDILVGIEKDLFVDQNHSRGDVCPTRAQSTRRHDELSRHFGEGEVPTGTGVRYLSPCPYYFVAFPYTVHFYLAVTVVSSSSPAPATPASLTFIPFFFPRRIKIPAASCDRGVPRAVEDFSFLDGAQLVTVFGGFLVGVSCVEYKGYPRVVYGLLPAKSGASRVLLGRSQRIPCERCAFQQQRLEVTFFLHFLPSRLELLDQADLSDSAYSGAEAGLRKRLRKAATEQPADAYRSTARTSAEKSKGIMELGEVPERGYTMRELYEVEDRAGADGYFTSIMKQLKCVEGEDPLVLSWSTISWFSPFWTEGPLSREYLRGALHPTLAKQVYECSSEELMNRGLHFISALIDRVHDASRLVRSQHEKIRALRAANKELKASIGQGLTAATERRAKELEAEIERTRTELESLRSQRREFEQEIELLPSSLDGARDDRARLEGDVLSLTEATAFLEGQKVISIYKASRGFESSLENMRRVNYEFGYRVALERLRGKHLDIMIELDPSPSVRKMPT